MAFGTPTARGTANSATSTTTLVLTPSATIAAGSFAFLATAWDNEGTTDAETTQLSVTDNEGNTWTRARERTNGSAGANAGAVAGLFYSVLGTALTTADSITITSTSARTSKAAQVFESTIGAASVNLDDGTVGEATGASNDFVVGGATLSSLANVEHLWVGVVAWESNTPASYTEDADYTTMADVVGDTGTSGTSMACTGGYRIFTGTTDTWDPSGDPGANAVDVAWCYVAFSEATAAAEFAMFHHPDRSIYPGPTSV